MDILDQALNEEVVAPEGTEAVVTEQVEAEKPRDEQGRFTKSEPPSPTNQLPTEEYKALREEREKRQALEAQLAALKAEQQPLPSVFEDEVAWQNQFGQHVVRTAVQEASLNSRLDMSEMMVAQAFPDFEDVKAEFLEMAKENPALAQQAMADRHPWNKAYQMAKNARAARELGATDIDSLTAKIREQVMQEMAAKAPALPNTLATSQNARGSTGAVVVDPIDRIFGP